MVEIGKNVNVGMPKPWNGPYLMPQQLHVQRNINLVPVDIQMRIYFQYVQIELWYFFE